MRHYSTYQSQFIEMFKDSPKSAISDFCKVEKGTTITRNEVIEGNIPVVAGGQEPSCYHNVANRKAGVITISASGAYSGFVNYWTTQIFASDCNTIIPIDEKNTNVHFLYHGLKAIQKEIYSLQKGGAQPHVYGKDIEKFLFPYPTKEEQDKFADIAQQADKSKFISLKSQFIEMFGNLDTNIKSYPVTTVEKISLNLFAGGDKPEDTSTERTDKYIYPVWANGEGERGLIGYSKTYRVDKEALTISARGTIGYCAIREPYFTPIVRLITLIPNEKVDIVYLKYFFDQTGFESTGAVQGQLTIPTIKVKKVLVPPIEEQMKFAEVVKQADKSKYIN